MIKITDTEIMKLSEALEVPYDTLQKLYSMNILHQPSIYRVLVKHDYTRIRRSDRYRPSQIVQAVANKYKLSVATVHDMVHRKPPRWFYCNECGKTISHREYLRGEGLCDECFARTIEV